MSTDADMDFTDYEEQIQPWIKNQATSVCKSLRTDWTEWSNPDPDLSEDDQIYELPNYLLCDKDTCRHMSDNKWNNVWGNCRSGVASGDPNSKDKCYNMITDTDIGPAPGGVGAGNYRGFQCDDSGDQFVPSRCECAEGGVKDATWCTNYKTNKNYYPAYPIDPITEIDDQYANTDNSTGNTASCPSPYSRKFICNRDGWDATGSSNYPGCGYEDPTNIDEDHEDAIRFCARDRENYTISNLMDCCLDPDKAPGDEERHINCPIGYCLKKVSLGEAGASASTCTPKAGKCYAMSTKCNELLREKCADINLWNSTSTDQEVIKKKLQCIKWSKIQRDTFNDYAGSICQMPAGPTYTTAEKEQIKYLFSSDICSEYLLNDNTGANSSMQKLKEICAQGVTEDPTTGAYTINTFGQEMGDVCKCNFPNDYYTWWKQNEAPEELRSDIGFLQKNSPECFYPECTTSGYYQSYYSSVEHPDCPSIQNCINEVNVASTFIGSGSNEGQYRRP